MLRSHRSALRGLAERLANVEQQADEALDATAAELAAINAKIDEMADRLGTLETRIAGIDGGQDLAELLAG